MEPRTKRLTITGILVGVALVAALLLLTSCSSTTGVDGIVAAFQWENVTDTQKVRFNNSSTGGKGANNQFLWRFGDGGQSNEINPIHDYRICDSFIVTLVACPSNDFTNSRCANVQQVVDSCRLTSSFGAQSQYDFLADLVGAG